MFMDILQWTPSQIMSMAKFNTKVTTIIMNVFLWNLQAFMVRTVQKHEMGRTHEKNMCPNFEFIFIPFFYHIKGYICGVRTQYWGSVYVVCVYASFVMIYVHDGHWAIYAQTYTCACLNAIEWKDDWKMPRSVFARKVIHSPILLISINILES